MLTEESTNYSLLVVQFRVQIWTHINPSALPYVHAKESSGRRYRKDGSFQYVGTRYPRSPWAIIIYIYYSHLIH